MKGMPSVSGIAIGFFFGFVVPFACVMLLASLLAPGEGEPASKLMPLYGVMWMLLAFAAPVVAGFLAARIAAVQPLLHGCLVGILGAVFMAVVTTPASAGLWAAFVFVPGGIAGGWLWKVRGPRPGGQ